MTDIAIKVENLSKQYRLGLAKHRQDTLRDTLADAVLGLNPFKPSHSDGDDETIWALKDVSFNVEHGEVLGVIGRNGAGKTTLLKILSRITEPTSGRATINGRVGSLLEVGTGFHPELTGRENIYLNGAILGMRRIEINRKFDQIVAFSEIEKFLDTPVKRYSSGMYIRLAFAVAAHLETEILLVDEVLAVGDMGFQKKCLGKMDDVAKQGRTVLFISHNMAAIESLCQKVLLLDKGRLIKISTSNQTISHYMNMYSSHLDNKDHKYSVNRSLLGNIEKGISITDVDLLSSTGNSIRTIYTGDPLKLRIYYKTTRSFISPAFVVTLRSSFGHEILRLSTMPISGYQIEKLGNKGYIDLILDSLPITAGRYYIDVGFVRERIEWIMILEELITIDIEPKDVYGSGMAVDSSKGIMVIPHHWVHHPEIKK